MISNVYKRIRRIYTEKKYIRAIDQLQLVRAYVEKFQEVKELEDKIEKIKLEANALYKQIKRKK